MGMFSLKSSFGSYVCALLVFLGLALGSVPSISATVYVVLSSDSSPYARVKQGFAKALGKAPDEQSRVKYFSLQEFQYLALQQRISAEDLVVSVGTNAAQEVISSTELASNILCIFLPKTTFESFRDADASDRMISAIYLDQPFERQLQLSRKILPKAARVGVLLGKVSSDRRGELQSVVQALHLKLQALQIGRGNFLKQIQPLLKSSDLVLAIPDPEVNSPKQAKRLLYSAYKRRVPVFGFSKSYVTAGALAAVYSTPEQIGMQAAELVLNFIVSGKMASAAAIPPKYYSVEINESVARSLGIAIPDSVRTR